MDWSCHLLDLGLTTTSAKSNGRKETGVGQAHFNALVDNMQARIWSEPDTTPTDPASIHTLQPQPFKDSHKQELSITMKALNNWLAHEQPIPCDILSALFCRKYFPFPTPYQF